MFKRKKLIVLSSAVIILGIGLTGFYRSKYVVPILMYHTVYPGAPYEHRLAVSTKTFERQMRFLRRWGYNILPLEELADLIRRGKKIPPRTVVITLDDGYRDNYDHVFPILKKYRIPATIFVIINEVGRQQNDRLNWQQISQMSDSGIVVFGSHALGAEPLVNLNSEDEIRRQIFDSKRILEEKLAAKVSLFSYPEGMFTPRIRQLVVEAGYSAAVATNPGKNYPNNDVYALKRLRISENCSNLFIFWFETSGIYTFFKEAKKKK